MILEKRCSVCHEIKLVEPFFGKDSTKHSKDGYKCRCRACEKELGRLLRLKQAQEQGRELKQSHADYQYDENGNCVARRCSTCKELKSTKEFDRSSRGRFGITNQCKECTRIKGKYYREKHKEEIKERKRKQRLKLEAKEKANKRHQVWRKKPESKVKQTEYQKRYDKRPYVIERKKKSTLNYLNNPKNKTKIRVYRTNYRKEHSERIVYNDNQRRVRELNAEGSHTLEQWRTLLSFFTCCPKCGKSEKLTMDHIIPLSKGGTNFIDNLQVLCFSCNSSKRDILIIDYRPRQVREWAHLETYGILDCTESQTML